jgi:hypothetical protein
VALRVALVLASVVFAAMNEWLLAFAMAGMLFLLLAVYWLGEKVGVTPDLKEARREYAAAGRRRPGESRLRYWWRLFLRDL